MNDNQLTIQTSESSLPATIESGFPELAASADINLLNEAARIREQFASIKTPEKEIWTRPGPGETTLYFVRRDYMARILTEKLPGWSWMIVDRTVVQFPANVLISTKAAYDVVVHGRLICHVTTKDGGRMPIIIDAIGGHRVERTESGGIMEAGDAFKSADDDAFKKACEKWGIARDIYRVKEMKREELIERRKNALLEAMQKLLQTQRIEIKEQVEKLYDRVAELVSDDNLLYKTPVSPIIEEIQSIIGAENE